MQDNQLAEQKTQNNEHNHHNPNWNSIFKNNLFLHLKLIGHQSSPCQKSSYMTKCNDNQEEKRSVVLRPHTVVNPNAVVIKVSCTSVTYFTMFALIIAETGAEIAEKIFCVIDIKFY